MYGISASQNASSSVELAGEIHFIRQPFGLAVACRKCLRVKGVSLIFSSGFPSA